MREKSRAFERVVFNVVFNNRDDLPKNFAYLMQPTGQWQLAPAYDVTFCEGPGGYHQMDVMGEALEVGRSHLMQLGQKKAELPAQAVAGILERVCSVASAFTATTHSGCAGQISPGTLRLIQGRIDDNVRRVA